MESMERHAPLIGRILIALPLLNFATYKLQHFDLMANWLGGTKGFPVAALFMGLAIATEYGGATAVMVGYRARWAAALLILYLIPVHLVSHDFWAIEDPAQAQSQFEQFGKGIMIMGGLLFVVAFGAGPISLDSKRRHSDSRSASTPSVAGSEVPGEVPAR